MFLCWKVHLVAKKEFFHLFHAVVAQIKDVFFKVCEGLNCLPDSIGRC